MKHLRIAIIGSRGIPGNYGGFETFAERLSVGLVERGHEVAVYCAASSTEINDRKFKGVSRILIPTIKSKSLEKLSNSLLSCVHAGCCKYDIALLLGVSPVLFSWLMRISGQKLIINIDGKEWKRQKWSRLASSFLEICERLSGPMCHEVVTDSKVLRAYFRERYGRNSTFIAYGADVGRYDDDGILKKYGLEKDKYLLQVCRLEPENNPLMIIREFRNIVTDLPLVILGDAPHSGQYKAKLIAEADRRVKFLGGIYGHDYDVIRSNPYCYIHGHEVGGTNPSLLEALAAGNCVAVLDVPYNLEVIGQAGLSFSRESGSMAAVVSGLLSDPQMIEKYRKLALDQIRNNYTWEYIIDEYEKLFTRCKYSRSQDEAV